MKCLRTLGVLLVTFSFAWSMTTETTSQRSTTQPISNALKNISNQLLETNTSTLNILDVRTPPRVKEKMNSKQSFESSHAGVAIPIDADIEILEESTKKMNFYKIERPTTTNGGLSTWILLSGQSSSTSTRPTTKKPSVKPLYAKDEKHDEPLVLNNKPVKVGKPLFKQRSTTPKPTTVGSIKTTTIKVNTFSTSPKSTSKKPAKITRVKASLLNISSNKSSSIALVGKNKSTPSTVISSTTTDKPNESKVSTTISKLSSTTEPTHIPSNNKTSVGLPVEAKEGEQELPSTDEKKKKTQKRKKNKNKRRKQPGKASKEGNNNKLKEVESPGTQLYSYLKSEIIPVTVGVSLVGLLVTAGLASYYLTPFAALRRSDPIDRKDTDGGYYYHDDYSNSIPEEEAIGKVIAGMPDNTLQPNNAVQSNNVLQPNSGNSFMSATSRNTYTQNGRFRHVDRRSQIYMNPYGSVEDVKINERERTAVSYEQNPSGYSNDNKFVVGSIPKDTVQEVTPAVVPEHGPRNLKVHEKKFVVGNVPEEMYFNVGASPRNLKIRRRRQIFPDDSENEISPEENEIDNINSFHQILPVSSTEKLDVTTIEETKEDNNTETIEEAVKITTPHNVWSPSERPDSFFELISDLFKLKVKLGLELIQNVTSSVSSYVSKVQSRLGEHYRQNGSRGNAFKPRR